MMHYNHKNVSDKHLRIDTGALKEMLHKKETDKTYWIKKEHYIISRFINKNWRGHFTTNKYTDLCMESYMTQNKGH